MRIVLLLLLIISQAFAAQQKTGTWTDWATNMEGEKRIPIYFGNIDTVRLYYMRDQYIANIKVRSDDYRDWSPEATSKTEIPYEDMRLPWKITTKGIRLFEQPKVGLVDLLVLYQDRDEVKWSKSSTEKNIRIPDLREYDLYCEEGLVLRGLQVKDISTKGIVDMRIYCEEPGATPPAMPQPQGYGQPGMGYPGGQPGMGYGQPGMGYPGMGYGQPGMGYPGMGYPGGYGGYPYGGNAMPFGNMMPFGGGFPGTNMMNPSYFMNRMVPFGR